ncbi:uncharacterized protein LOC124370036 [Homalodisca vitripennis]|uniref:uncharacterized protein LOC124370036 n=1 Tax=Homalodisca vitripennis TaxID=197043 RepID=UPI001EECB032|nr:uncharacterized protein LOC124370036 [Homalodisca vitripennis]
MLLVVLSFVVGSFSLPIDDLASLSAPDYDDSHIYIETVTLKLPLKDKTDPHNGTVTWDECSDVCKTCDVDPENENGALCVCAAENNKQSECLSESIKNIRKKGLKYEVIKTYVTDEEPFDSFLKDFYDDNHPIWEELTKRLAQDNARDERCLSLATLGSPRASLQSILGDGLRTDLTLAERAAEFRKRVEALRSLSILGLRRAQADGKDPADSGVKPQEAPQTLLPVSPFLDTPLGQNTPEEIKDLVKATDGVVEKVVGTPNLEDLPKKIDDTIGSLIPEQDSTLTKLPHGGVQLPADLPGVASLQKSSDTLATDLKDNLGSIADLKHRSHRSPNPSILDTHFPGPRIPNPTVQSPTVSSTKIFGRKVSHNSSD